MTLFKLCNAIYWLALTLWVAALITAGIAAMNVFGTLDSLPIELKQYSALTPQEQGRLAAGKIMEGVFFTVDLLQLAAAPLAVFTLLLQLFFFKRPGRLIANGTRTACIVLAAAALAYHATALAPAMNRELRSYWKAAEAGDLDLARTHRAAFDARHPLARQLSQITLVLLLIGVASSAAALSPELAASKNVCDKQ